MFDILLQRLDHGARMSLPFVTALLCVLFSAAAWPIPYFGAVAPPLAFIAVYYWSIHRPDLFWPSMAFVIGLLNDIVHSLPLGMSALLFVGAYQLILYQRRFFTGHSFLAMWAGFAVTAFGLTFIEWILQSLIGWKIMPPLPILIELVLAILFFPIPCWLFIKLQRVALSQA